MDAIQRLIWLAQSQGVLGSVDGNRINLTGTIQIPGNYPGPEPQLSTIAKTVRSELKEQT